ncbi:hypothetical protein JCM3775_003472 [Rhodotorula graminis]
MAPTPYLVVRSPLDLAAPRLDPTSQPASAPPSPASTNDRVHDLESNHDYTLDSTPHPGKRALAASELLAAGSTSGASLARRSLAPNDTQKVTLGVIAAYAVLITILWNVPVIHWVLWPFKLLVVAFHEFSHAVVGCCTGAKVKSITLDPREGGCTMMAGGIGALTLPAGYLGSSLIGALLVFCGFDVRASKIASLVVGVMFLLTLWWGKRDWLTILTILVATGLIVACWFIAHGVALRFYMLFLGVMNSLYSLYDICDDLIFRKVNESDASVFAKRYGGSSACWGVLWFIISLCFLAAGIVAGLAAFKDTFSQQATTGSEFLPTRF